MKGPVIAIIDYGMGNTFSVSNALQQLGAEAVVTDNHLQIIQADGIILPGVGAFSQAMNNLKVKGLDTLLIQLLSAGQKPFLGICLGMQLLAKTSLEGGMHSGLCLIDAQVLPIPSNSLKIPHVGWNNVTQTNGQKLFNGIPDETHFYFDHSFHLLCNNTLLPQTATTDYGFAMTASIEHNNIFGVQFHPEKSQHYGLKLLENFLSEAIERSSHS